MTLTLTRIVIVVVRVVTAVIVVVAVTVVTTVMTMMTVIWRRERRKTMQQRRRQHPLTSLHLSVRCSEKLPSFRLDVIAIRSGAIITVAAMDLIADKTESFFVYQCSS